MSKPSTKRKGGAAAADTSRPGKKAREESDTRSWAEKSHAFRDKVKYHRGRHIGVPCKDNTDDLGPLQDLPGTWVAKGTGWNLIALPFQDGQFRYRVLMNQYDETLKFVTADPRVPNRGIRLAGDSEGEDPDQFIVALDYEQIIQQVAVEDFPPSSDEIRGEVPKGIHHESGMWLHMLDERTRDIDVARLASIPHGNSVLALGKSSVISTPEDLARFRIPFTSGLPIGVSVPDTLRDRDVDPAAPAYLDPYRHFANHPFFGTVPTTVPNFPGFAPDNPEAILNFANEGLEAQGLKIVRVTELNVDTTTESGGINNIPFIVRQADSASMKSTFWLQELEDRKGNKSLRLQYMQVVMLDFFGRRDGLPGRIRWPHVSIATLDKVAGPPQSTSL